MSKPDHPVGENMTRKKHNKALNIGFVSTRFAGTDGVSLETAKWETVLLSFGHNVFWFSGESDRPVDRSVVVPEAFFNHPANLELNNGLFGTQHRSRALTDEIHRRKEHLKDRIYQFIGDFQIDLLIAENALAIPMQIPLGLALTEVIAETEIPAIGHHHDFWWERSRFLLNAVQDILQAAFPPDLPSVRHAVINSMIQKDLAARRGIASTVITNVIDFDERRKAPTETTEEIRRDLGFGKDDILILQPTRVVSRKGIEQALYLIKRLDMPKAKLIISHSAGDEGQEYFEWIMDTARQQEIPVHFLYNRLHETRRFSEDGQRLYSLWDIYPHVDLVTYPSLYEGFGNAFLEAVYFRKPLLINRYSVYIVDIEPKGFDCIAIDGFLTQRAVEQVREVLLNGERRQEMVEKNFQIARKFFSTPVLRRRLGSLLGSFYGHPANGSSA